MKTLRFGLPHLLLFVFALVGASACHSSVRRPLFRLRPREVGTFAGTIAVEGRPPAAVTSCVAHRWVSQDGVSDAADFRAKDDYNLRIEPAPAAAKLTIGSEPSARTLSLAPGDCAEHDVHFFQRQGTLHGSVSLDCATPEGRVKVSASFDNCGPSTTPHTIETRSTPFSRERTIR